MLILLNGPPGVGKSALAVRYADEHRLALIVDIDDLRGRLGQWRRVDESKPVARDLAVALVDAHLRGGYDVIIPQYLSGSDFVERLTGVAREAGTSMVEVVLTDRDDRLVDRFRNRRADFVSIGVRHPEADLTDDVVDAEIRSANARLRSRASAHGLPLIDMGAGLDTAYLALCDATASTA